MSEYSPYADFLEELCKRANEHRRQLIKALRFIQELAFIDVEIKNWITNEFESRQYFNSGKDLGSVFTNPTASIPLMSHNSENRGSITFCIFKTKEGFEAGLVTQEPSMLFRDVYRIPNWGRILVTANDKRVCTASCTPEPDSFWVVQMCEHMRDLESTREVLQMHILSIKASRQYG